MNEETIEKSPLCIKEHQSLNILPSLRFLDLQKACIVRGIDFDFMVKQSIYELQNWATKNWRNTILVSRLEDFDEWRFQIMKARGKEDEPFVRMGYLGPQNPKTGEIVAIKAPEPLQKKKIKRLKDKKSGIFLGTKKALTFQCTGEGKSMEETIKIVMAKFPEAKEKSIKIWIKRSKAK